MAMLEDFISHAAEGGRIGVIFVDVDDIYSINEVFGHYTGDKMIIAIARAIESCIEPEHIAARPAGDEFLIVVPDYSAVQVLELAETIRAHAANVTIEDHEQQIGPRTLTIGVSCFPDDGKSALELMEQVDAALWAGKSRGRNCVVATSELPAKPPSEEQT